ncbi:4Fe-4S dicluster domain-containing protein [Actinocorallia sp. A-T 12471]|uniref:4Fe-4S dicluster domain-containing protein n=1 Tax=Actinocorallia sp. A-T 12471 TaxID=3089813 RepID=UPI0029CE7384|nr:4Fe-4S dicluster domain-containing protein [Actinocorallia sp. A-T 12471]MDX6741947.1 4Fe-4S dicluster domain-containing protein [Actinocorallia sp. A-T 12471]
MFLITLIIGLAGTAVALALAGKRVLFLVKLFRSGQPAPDRVASVKRDPKGDVEGQVTEVLGQKKLLKWTVAGLAHFFVMWAFFLLATVYLEAGVALLFGLETHIPFVQTWGPIGFIQDFIAVMCALGLLTFAIIRFKNAPKTKGRKSRFFGSHLGGAWLILFMIFNVIWTMFFFRGTLAALETVTGQHYFPFGKAAFGSYLTGLLLDGFSETTLKVLASVGLLAHIGVALVFLVIVVNSKHLHIFIAPLNVLYKRRPNGLGAAMPVTKPDGTPLDFEEADPDEDLFGRSKIEDFTWKGFLDFATCTECGRCQSQCPAWNTEKPLSPKLLILELRDHAFHKAPYMLATDEQKAAFTDEQKLAMEVDKPLVGEDGVIHPDVLWSCTNCGACVEQCPVDIEHIDHILDMRRYQAMIESSFPSEAGVMLRNLENKGNPWGMGEMKRLEWIEELDFEVEVIDEKIPEDAEYLFWVGCAGALEDRAKKTTKAVAELLHTAGVKFAVLGPMEACTGDPARRLGMEYLFQGMAQQNVETLNDAGVKKIVATCPHCFNTLANEYPQVGGHYEVVHHTQLLADLVDNGKLVPVTAIEENITYHDPCFLGRHNKVYKQPRDIMAKVPGVKTQEMHRCKDKGFCCGAGGARMWMEERIGKRINTERVDEALETNPDTVSTACPFCLVMLGDAINEKKSSGEAKESLEVVDVAQLLLKSIKGEPAVTAAAE